MKRVISKEEYEGLSEDLQKLYTLEGEEYILPLEDYEDPGALKRAKDHEKEARKKAEASMKELKEQVEELQRKIEETEGEKARKKGDVDSIEASYQKKLSDQQAKYQEKEAAMQKLLESKTIDAEARRLATELSGENADIILPHVRSRMRFEMEDGQVHIRVLDESGNPTGDTLEDLKKNFLANTRFKAIVVGSRASGSGASGSTGGGGSTKKLKEMSKTEVSILARTDPEEFNRRAKAEGFTFGTTLTE